MKLILKTNANSILQHSIGRFHSRFSINWFKQWLAAHLHWRIFVIRSSPSCQLNSRDPETPDISFEIITPNLRGGKLILILLLQCHSVSKMHERQSRNSRKTLTCSITSGAIQHGVPTNVFLTLFLVMSPPVAKKALTPKSSQTTKRQQNY